MTCSAHTDFHAAHSAAYVRAFYRWTWRFS